MTTITAPAPSPSPPPSAAAYRTVPHDRDGDDYARERIVDRQRFVTAVTGVHLLHVGAYSFDPTLTRGNIENFTGVAQVPIGFAGPLRVNGEYARGDFVIPLATTEGSLVASYNRGMKVLNLAGGVTCTISADCMQRAPVFVFDSAREARAFRDWVDEHLAEIRATAEATSHVARLLYIDPYLSNKFAYLRFNFATGDAAGQNMTGKATLAACEWIKNNYPGRIRYFLSGNIDTDKKHSHLNTLLTRGKRVVAEAVIQREAIEELMHVDTRNLFWTRQVQMTGAFLAGSANNGAHSANGLAALFLATGQDVANIAESQAAITYSQYLDDGNYYWSITLPSLIVGTCGGGTGLATQKQCLEMLGCYGQGKVKKFAEICAAVVLAGETSLAGAMLNGDWVSAHERLGRNRPPLASE